MIKVELKGGEVREYAKGTTALDIVKTLGQKLQKSACSARVNGKVVDLQAPIEDDCTLEIVTFDDVDGTPRRT